MSEVVALLSGVQERLTERLGPLKAWLFPRQVYLQLEDEAITAMALEGRRIVWLERVQLPVGLCEGGEPIRVDSLGDLLGDLFVERGYTGARVTAVLPSVASQMRLVRWPDGRWPDDPERVLALNESEIGLRQPLQFVDLSFIPLPQDPPTSLLVTVSSNTLKRWIEVFSLAELTLERMEAAKVCLCRGLQLGLAPISTSVALLQVEPNRCALVVLQGGVPVYERRLPGAAQFPALIQELVRWRQFWEIIRPAETETLQLVLHGSALGDKETNNALSQACRCTFQLLDPLVNGWLDDPFAEAGAPSHGPALAVLWGLAAAEVTL